MPSCVKCCNEAVVIVRLKDGFCRDCFLVHVVHKFRASIGKSKLIRDDENVLIAYSAGAASTCLLHLIQEGVSARSLKKVRFNSSVAFIDESTALNLSEDERISTLQHVVDVIRNSHFPGYIAHLEQSLNIPANTKTPQNIGVKIDDTFDVKTFVPNQSETEKLTSLLQQTGSISAKEDLLRILRHRLLLSLAESANCTKIAVADCSNRLAVTMLSDFARGRGAHVSYNMGFSDDRSEDTIFFRPLKDFTSKEVVWYNRFYNLQPCSLPTLTSKGESKTSIERLTQDFITNLQADYGSTVPNINRTGEKLFVAERESEPKKSCSFCLCPLDTNVSQSSALNSVHISLNLPRRSDQPIKTQHQLNESSSNTCPDVISSLCYGCRVIAGDMTDTTNLPLLTAATDTMNNDSTSTDCV